MTDELTIQGEEFYTSKEFGKAVTEMEAEVDRLARRLAEETAERKEVERELERTKVGLRHANTVNRMLAKEAKSWREMATNHGIELEGLRYEQARRYAKGAIDFLEKTRGLRSLPGDTDRAIGIIGAFLKHRPIPRVATLVGDLL